MKRLFSSLLAVVLVFALSINALAAIPTVYYNDGSSVLQYSLTNGTFGDAFENMIPGVTRTQQIALQNNGSKDSIRFFMSVQVLKTLINAAKDGAVPARGRGLRGRKRRLAARLRPVYGA